MYTLTENGNTIMTATFERVWRYFVRRYGHLETSLLTSFKIERVK